LDEEYRAVVDHNVRMRKRQGFLTPLQRRLAWLTVVVMALYSPLVARLASDDSWMLSVTVAALVAFTIVMDDVESRRDIPRDIPTDEV